MGKRRKVDAYTSAVLAAVLGFKKRKYIIHTSRNLHLHESVGTLCVKGKKNKRSCSEGRDIGPPFLHSI